MTTPASHAFVERRANNSQRLTRRQWATLLGVAALAPTTLQAGLDDKGARYIGGSITALPEDTEGQLDLKDETTATFQSRKGSIRIPYEGVTTIEYGQKVGRRVGATIALGITTLGIGALPVLFSKKRRHYMTVGYRDDGGRSQAVVLELGKNVTRGTLAALEAKTGKQVEYESEEARRYAGN